MKGGWLLASHLEFTRKWRNWYTRYLEVVVEQSVGVRVPSFAMPPYAKELF